MDSNHRPTGYEPAALTAELPAQSGAAKPSERRDQLVNRASTRAASRTLGASTTSVSFPPAASPTTPPRLDQISTPAARLSSRARNPFSNALPSASLAITRSVLVSQASRITPRSREMHGAEQDGPPNPSFRQSANLPPPHPAAAPTSGDPPTISKIARRSNSPTLDTPTRRHTPPSARARSGSFTGAGFSSATYLSGCRIC